MSHDGDIAAFRRKLEDAQVRFRDQETIVRSEYNAAVESGREAGGRSDEELLEHTTRLFVIDPVLDALGWSASDPTRVVQEARSWTRDQARDRLYFDYLGVCGMRTPVLAVEAKGLDASAPRRPRAPEPGELDMASMIAQALDALKANKEPAGLLGEWVEWLRAQRSYVDSLGEPQRVTLRRLVMTSGRWLIVFEDPKAAFLGDARTDAGRIHCFASFEDQLAGHRKIFELLHRDRLVNTLPLTLSLDEVLRVIDRTVITRYYRAVVVATDMSGAVRQRYPTRTLYPAVLVQSGGVDLAIVDYGRKGLEEPLSPDEKGFATFLGRLQSQATAFEAEVVRSLAMNSLTASAVSTFATPAPTVAVEAVADSIAAAQAVVTPPRLALVRETGEAQRGGGGEEYLVVTGESWFYKLSSPSGPECALHAWPKAKAAGFAEAAPHLGEAPTSYTASGDMQHCADTRVYGHRANRCHVDMIESHLCCRACIFQGICWSEHQEAALLPCP